CLPRSPVFSSTALFRSLAHCLNACRAFLIFHMVGLCVICNQHTVCTVSDRLVRVHVSVHSEVIRKYESLESPLAAENGLEQFARSEEHTSELQSRFDLV